jgi:hypothetical protein
MAGNSMAEEQFRAIFGGNDDKSIPERLKEMPNEKLIKVFILSKVFLRPHKYVCFTIF